MIILSPPSGSQAKGALGNNGVLYPLNASNQITVPFKVGEVLVPAGWTVVSVTTP